MVNLDQEVAELLRSAEEMIVEVDIKLDNSDHVFLDGSGEKCCKSLRELAKKLDAAGYSSMARELSSRADEVKDRTENWGL